MSFNKVTTFIAGLLNDSDFNYVCFIAENLSQILPNFAMKKIPINLKDWKVIQNACLKKITSNTKLLDINNKLSQDWIDEKCNTHGWSHSESPLIWRESGVCGGACNYVGDKCAFMKLINDYYGINYELSELQQKNLDLDYLKVLLPEAQYFKSEYNSKKRHFNPHKITISGAGRSICPDLVAELATMKEISDHGIEINLYDTPGHFFKVKDIVKDAAAIGAELVSIKIIENFPEGLSDCNILIILDHIIREDNEEVDKWLIKNYNAAKEITEQINLHAPPDMKVILCSMGPTCLWANIIAKETTKLNKNCIVAVSMHYGLEMMYDFLNLLKISKKYISCPPVWGFLGINHYVDICHTIQKCSVYMPNKRALVSSNNSTLPLGYEYKQFRWLLYLAADKKPHLNLAERKAICMYQVGRTEDFQKCKAIGILLRLWYQKDESEIGDHIITLGILSDGTFGFESNIFLSQPVCLKILEDNSRVWVPCQEYPLPIDNLILKNLIETAKLILKDMNVIN